MNTLPRIRVMVSSRSESKVFDEQVKLADVRKRLQSMLHSVRWLAPGSDSTLKLSGKQQVFDVWIHENEKAKSRSRSNFELSLDEINRADIVIVLYNGEAGWSIDDRGIGICHAEYREAESRRGNITYALKLEPIVKAAGTPDVKFQKDLEDGHFYVTVKSEADLHKSVFELLQKAVAELVHRGARGGRSRDRGLALHWSKLDMVRRRDQMRRELVKELVGEDSSTAGDEPLPIEIAGQKLTIRLDAVPGAMGVAAAREMVGQPFLRDHLHVERLSKRSPGIVHIIACYKGVTENQANKIIGTPDTITVASDFGVYAADHVQQIQMIFLAQCADAVAVSVAVRRLSDWLQQTGEISLVFSRAQGRFQILKAIHSAIEKSEQGES